MSINELKYIKQLTEEERDELLKCIGFDDLLPPLTKFFSETAKVKKTLDCFGYTKEVGYNSGKKIETWNVEKEFTPVVVEDQKLTFKERTYVKLCMNDFDILDFGVGKLPKEAKLSVMKNLFRYMYDRFGEEYKNDCLEYLNNSKKRKVNRLNEKYQKETKIVKGMKDPKNLVENQLEIEVKPETKVENQAEQTEIETL